MCVTDTGSGRRQEPLLGQKSPEECVYKERAIECMWKLIYCETSDNFTTASCFFFV